MNADNLTMLCRERDVEANDSLQRQFTPSCKVSKVSSEITIAVYSPLERCSRWWVSFSAKVLAYVFFFCSVVFVATVQ